MRIGKRSAAFALAATLIAILACLPWSGWMVRQQLRAAVGGSLTNATAGRMPTARERVRERQTAAAHPDDFGIQLAMAYQTRPGILGEPGAAVSAVGQAHETDPTKAARALWDLRDRFPQEPSLYGNMLRYLTADAVRIRRDKELMELEPKGSGPVSASVHASSRPQKTPELLALFDRAAAEGERLDPDNGYFPAMRAVGLFAAHRDNEALLALRRASRKSEWKEYSADEVRGNVRLMTLTYGEPGSFARFGQMNSLLFFHYGPLRTAVRLAAVQAIHLEQRGKTAEGFTVRRDISRVGALVRTRASWLIGNLLGISLGTTAQLRPGGSPPLVMRNPSHTADPARDSLIRTAYFRYLERIGEPQEAEFVRAEAKASENINSLLQASSELGYIRTLRPIAGGWILGTALLSSASVILIFGATCLLLARSRHLTDRTALVSVVFLSSVVLGVTFAFLGPRIIEPFHQWLALFQGMAFYSDATPERPGSDWSVILSLLPQLIGCLVLSSPMLLVLVLAKRAGGLRRPRADVFVRSCAACALPSAAVLLAVYSLVAVSTLGGEAALRVQAEHLSENETAFLAQAANQPVPGFVPGQELNESRDKELVR